MVLTLFFCIIQFTVGSPVTPFTAMVYTFAQLPPRQLSEDELPPKTISLNITRTVNSRPAEAVLTQADIMALTQRAWRLNPGNANDADLILATYNDPDRGKLILGAFRFGRIDEHPGGDHFFQSPFDDPGRCIFLAEPAPEEVWKKYVGHYLPKVKPGEANPVRYYDPE